MFDIRCQQIAGVFRKLSWCQIDDIIDTNILFIKIENSVKIAEMFHKKNILVSIWSPYLLRMVFHRDLTDKDIEMIEDAILSLE